MMKIEEFGDWYNSREEDSRTGKLTSRGISNEGSKLTSRFDSYKREMDGRVKGYEKLLQLADAEVITKKPDLPNVSSGETSGMILRMARNLVQHTPNVNIVSVYDDDKAKGILVGELLKSRIIGDDQYSNDMQQNLFASTKNALTLGFDCVIPVLLQDAGGSWYMQYDNIFYRDVFPEPAARDIRRAHDVFVRRYLSKGDVHSLIQNQVTGWDHAALRCLLDSSPRSREHVDHENEKHHTRPEGYEIITWYSDTGDPFLTFDPNSKNLLRIEKNKHPLKQHPVFFLVLEKDLNQPLGKSQVERVLGRQEFQDLLLNGAMKMWYKNINPPLIGYGTSNAIINLSPGKFNNIGNPNARVEAFEVNTQTLLQFGSISQQNAGNMVQQIGAADQQMASQNTGGMMSQTPQGVEAQQAMVDITTNNYQKAIENFFSRYCSYALTLYFHELKGVKEIVPTADTREKLIRAEFPTDQFDPKTGAIKIDFSDLAREYFIHTVPGSLIELEDEKQVRILNELFVPLSQAMPAVAASGDQQALQKMSAAMQYIVQQQLKLSGSMHSTELEELMTGGNPDVMQLQQESIDTLQGSLGELTTSNDKTVGEITTLLQSQQAQISLLVESQTAILGQLGIQTEPIAAPEPEIVV